jgi:hypothetical protein
MSNKYEFTLDKKVTMPCIIDKYGVAVNPETILAMLNSDAQTFYVIKRDDEPRYFDCNEERWRKSVQFCLEDESYLQGVMSNEHNKHLRGALIVKVRVSEVDG